MALSFLLMNAKVSAKRVKVVGAMAHVSVQLVKKSSLMHVSPFALMEKSVLAPNVFAK